MLHKRSFDKTRAGSSYWRRPVTSDEIDDIADSIVPSNNDFKLLAENIPTLCWIARGDGYIFWYNRRWHDYCGSTPAAMEGWGWQSVHHPDQLSQVMENWQKSITTGEPFEMIFPLRGADGQFRRFLTRIVPVIGSDGQVARWLGTNTEIENELNIEAALEASEGKLNVLTNAMPQMVWSTLPDGYHDYYNARWYEFTGMPYGSTDGEGWSNMFHEEDQPLASQRWQHSLATGEPYEVEYRLRHHSGQYRWTLGRALPVRDVEGIITRWIGTCTDIDDAKRDAVQTELMSRELSHRIKNIFAVIAGLIGLSAPRGSEEKNFANQLADRIAALGRAHNFARPHSPFSQPDIGFTTLRNLIGELMQPYETPSGKPYEITGDDVPIGERSATPVALVIHELATNAVKYGALNSAAGRIVIEIKTDGDVVIIKWKEANGPEIPSVPLHSGFGTQLSDISISGQLGGTLVRHWPVDGLQVVMTVPTAHL